MKLLHLAGITSASLCLMCFSLYAGETTSSPQNLTTFYNETFITGKPGTANTEFGLVKNANYPEIHPNAIAVDDNENLYILDPGNTRIVVYGKAGNFLRVVTLKALKRYQIDNPWGSSLAVDSVGNIFVFTRSLDFSSDIVVVKIDQQGEIVSQYASTAGLKKSFAPASAQYQKRFNKIKAAHGMKVLPETIGRIIKPFVDKDGNVYALAEQGTLIPLTQESGKTLSHPGHPTENRENYLIREPEVPLTDDLKTKPAAIKKLLMKNEKGEIVGTITTDDLKKYFPAGATIQDVLYKGADRSGNKYFLVFAEGIDPNTFVIRISSKSIPTALTAIAAPIANHPFTITHSGTIYQIDWDADEMDKGVSILKIVAK